ncbi:MAG: hypothetical protein U0531_06240 [Dehalococcoidia bacterium]
MNHRMTACTALIVVLVMAHASHGTVHAADLGTGQLPGVMLTADDLGPGFTILGDDFVRDDSMIRTLMKQDATEIRLSLISLQLNSAMTPAIHASVIRSTLYPAHHCQER